MFHVNIQGLKSKINEFEVYLCHLKQSYDFLCISEHWLRESEVWNGMVLSRWHVVSCFARTEHIHGGVVVFARRELDCCSLDSVNRLSSEVHCELSATFCKTLNVMVVCLYRSPSGLFDEFCTILAEMLEILSDRKRVIIAGDFNIKFGSLSADERVLTDLLTSHGFIKTISDATRGRNCLDNVFINYAHAQCDSQIYDTRLSDHLAQVIVLPDDSGRCADYVSRVVRPITGVGCNMFFNLFDSADFQFLSNRTLGCNEMYTRFHNMFMSFFAASFPERRLSARKTDQGINWFNNNLKKERLQYELICDLYNRYRTNDLLEQKRQARHHYRVAISQSKVQACSEYIDGSGNKPRAVWTVINSIRGAPKKRTPPLDPSSLNAYFVEAPERLVNALPVIDELPLDLCGVRVDKDVKFSLSQVSNGEIRDIIKSIKSSNTKDIYGITTNFVKRNISLFVSPISIVVNRAFSCGEFPDLLKMACVVPVHKGGDFGDVSNYRPISILPVFSKVFERAIYNRLCAFLESNGILYHNQFGFRKQRRTSDAVLSFTNCCLQAFESGCFCLAMFLDLSRAFDCVSHTILLQKLKNVYNFDNLTLQLIKSYLDGRCQVVVAADSMSASLPVCRGVPQGSILGPLLFLLYFNDFPIYINQSDDVECILYADDATLLVRGRDFDGVRRLADAVLEKVRTWAVANQLTLNDSKTVTMALTLRNLTYENPKSTKFLGIHISSPSLKFEDHASIVGTKICRNIFVLRRLTGAVTPEVLRGAYFALIHSHLTYCILAWGNTAASEYIFKLQRRAVRLLGGIGYTECCKNVFMSQGILPLPCEYILNSILHANSHRHSFVTNGDMHHYETRGRGNVRLDYCRLSRSQQGPFQMSKLLFNKLPPSCRCLTNDSLRARLKVFLLRNVFYKIQEFLDCQSVNI